MENLEKRRIARQLQLPGFGVEQQTALHDSHVLIVGMGGLGCPILQQLAAAGVGHVTIVDDDVVELTNIHRQVLFGADDIGKKKVDVAAVRARALQPAIDIWPQHIHVDKSTIMDLLHGVDLVLDGTDNFPTKYLVADACEATGTPLVWGTVLRFHGDVALWHSGPSSPDDRGVGLRDLFPRQLDSSEVPNCADAGVLGATTSVVGGLMATTAIAWLTGLDRSIGRVLSYDAIPGSTRSFQVDADPEREVVTQLGYYFTTPPAAEKMAAVDAIDATDFELTPGAELLQHVRAGQALLLDIREPHETWLKSWPTEDYTVQGLPLSNIDSDDDVLTAIGDHHAVVVACASGQRSEEFVSRYAELAKANAVTLYNLPGGINAHVA